MTQTYFYYLRGCSANGILPLPLEAFDQNFGLYQADFYNAVDFDFETCTVRIKPDYRPDVSWGDLRRLARLVEIGREMAHGSGGSTNGGNFDTDGGVGVREPLHPKPPTITGAAAKSLPGTVPIDQIDYDRSLLY